jgi:hypothetical protein
MKLANYYNTVPFIPHVCIVISGHISLFSVCTPYNLEISKVGQKVLQKPVVSWNKYLGGGIL